MTAIFSAKEPTMKSPVLVLFISVALVALELAWGGHRPLAADGDPAKGKGLYEKYCLACHGPQGKGDGHKQFNPPVADLTSPKVLKKPNSQLLRSIHEGRANTAMGAWKWVLSEEETRDVLEYVLTFPR